VLREHPGVADALVAGVEDHRWGRRPAALVVPAGGAHPSPDELAGFCKERLPPWKVPIAFRHVAALPRSEGGKLARREGESMFFEMLDRRGTQ
jgi:O-succinylbenzoic acid--CoA ligase